MIYYYIYLNTWMLLIWNNFKINIQSYYTKNSTYYCLTKFIISYYTAELSYWRNIIRKLYSINKKYIYVGYTLPTLNYDLFSIKITGCLMCTTHFIKL